ncbi:MAG: hypothetical protein ACXVPQ_00260 [Bacteroidia bacterium]
MSLNQDTSYLNGKMYDYPRLIAAIEQLEKDGIISFDEFEKLPFHKIQKQYFSTPQPTMIMKAKIIIRDKREGKTEPSEYSCKTTIQEGDKIKDILKTYRF